MLVIMSDPSPDCPDQREWAGPFLQPKALLFESADDPLRIRVAFRIVVTGEGLMNPQDRTDLHERQRGRLAPVITHQAQVLASCPIGKLAVDRHIQGGQPMPTVMQLKIPGF